MMADIENVIVSWNEKGFWDAQRFVDDEPEEWFSMPRDADRTATVERARAKWPNLPIRIEDKCPECGGSGEYDDGDGPEPCSMCDGEGVVVAELNRT
jgi:hypothetical protein